MESTQVFQKPIKLNFGSKTYTFKTDSEVLKVAQEYSWTEKCDFFEDFCRTFVDRNKVESSDPYYYAYIVKVIIEHSRCDAIHLSFPDYRNYKWLRTLFCKELEEGWRVGFYEHLLDLTSHEPKSLKNDKLLEELGVDHYTEWGLEELHNKQRADKFWMDHPSKKMDELSIKEVMQVTCRDKLNTFRHPTALEVLGKVYNNLNNFEERVAFLERGLKEIDYTLGRKHYEVYSWMTDILQQTRSSSYAEKIASGISKGNIEISTEKRARKQKESRFIGERIIVDALYKILHEEPQFISSIDTELFAAHFMKSEEIPPQKINWIKEKTALKELFKKLRDSMLLTLVGNLYPAFERHFCCNNQPLGPNFRITNIDKTRQKDRIEEILRRLKAISDKNSIHV